MELYENGGMYVGTFSEGKKSGKGHFKWVININLLKKIKIQFYVELSATLFKANGEVFDGEWKGGTKHGSGLWKGPKGNL